MNAVPLQIDFNDPTDIRTKLPQVREILAQKQAQADAARREVMVWRQVLDTLTRLADVNLLETEPVDEDDVASEHESQTAASTARTDDAQHDWSGEGQLEQVVYVVERENRPIRPREVAEILTRERRAQVAPATVASVLYYAALRAKPPRIQKLKERGLYAPLSYPTTDYEYAGSLGFPAPEHLPAGNDGEDEP